MWKLPKYKPNFLFKYTEDLCHINRATRYRPIVFINNISFYFNSFYPVQNWWKGIKQSHNANFNVFQIFKFCSWMHFGNFHYAFFSTWLFKHRFHNIFKMWLDQVKYVSILFIINEYLTKLQAKMFYTVQKALWQEIIGNHWVNLYKRHLNFWSIWSHIVSWQFIWSRICMGILLNFLSYFHRWWGGVGW